MLRDGPVLFCLLRQLGISSVELVENKGSLKIACFVIRNFIHAVIVYNILRQPSLILAKTIATVGEWRYCEVC